MTLKSSIYVLFVPVMLLLAILACAGTVLTAVPTYICPTSVPPTAVVVTPGGPPTPVVLPTLPPTPYIIQPPQDFYLNDAVDVGGVSDPQRVRFRLQTVASYAVGGQGVYAWELAVSNIGSEAYDLFPSVQMVLSSIQTDIDELTGAWAVSTAAGAAVGVNVADEFYTLLPGETGIYPLAAFGPVGTAHRFRFALASDGSTASNTLTWINTTNPYCTGDVSTGGQ